MVKDKKIILWLLYTLLTGCGGYFTQEVKESESYDNQKAQPPASEKGYSFLVNGNYIGCGVPVSVMRRAFQALQFMPQKIQDTFFPLVTKNPFKKPDIPGRKGLNKDLSVVYNSFRTKRGVDVMYLNCLSCHSEKIAGQTIIGLGNTTWDYTQDISLGLPFLSLFTQTNMEKKEMSVFKKRINAIAPYIKTSTIGANPAINLTYALFMNRDAQTGAWVENSGLTPPPTDFPPVDVPPWWRMGLKKSMFYNGEFKNKHSFVMSLASLMCQDEGRDLINLSQQFQHLEAYIKSLKAPPYPGDVDKELANVGKYIFQKQCADCHGSYGKQLKYTEKFIPLDIIKTDPWLAQSQTGAASLRFRKFGKALFQNLLKDSIKIIPEEGYIAPSLNGIWATAPYFHNGSVPTMAGVLNSAIRPKYWKRKKGYDVENMSLHFEKLAFGKAFTPYLLKRYVYDTTLKGYSHQGHTFGDKLSQKERSAVLEYLKTL